MASSDVNVLLQQGKQKFLSEFNSPAEWAGCAPGRVNLIGEHTDYNDGFVLPMALPFVTLVIGKKTENGICRIITTSPEADHPLRIEFFVPAIDTLLTPSVPKWANYVKGIITFFEGPRTGFDAVIVTSVPIGGGLSSSASLEVAMYSFLEGITQYETNDMKKKALICQKAEHEFAKMPCGIMDQFISVFGSAGNALLIDCRSLELSNIPVHSEKYCFLIINSNVHHELTGSEYPMRRAMCHKVATLLNKKSLRDATLQELDALYAKNEINLTEFKRGRHVITEIYRTSAAAKVLQQEDYSMFGQLMNASHNSLRDDYEVSCPELDQLVEIVRKVPEVLGSRMTGGGFGGCTVSLIEKQSANRIIELVKKQYKGKPSFYVAVPSAGARTIKLDSI